MKTPLKKVILTCCVLFIPMSVSAKKFDAAIPMRDKGAATYYVPGHIEGVGEVEFMVDTGSGYMTINEETLETLSKKGKVKYVRKLTGKLANGSRMVVPVYAVEQVRLGEHCSLKNVEAAVFPGKTRFILGLNALKQASPFIFSIEPPELVLSNCLTAQAD